MGCATSAESVVPQSVVARANENYVQVHAELTRVAGGPLGMRVHHCGSMFLVSDIDEHGVVAAWNAQHPSMKVSRGDRIIAVNSVPVHNPQVEVLKELRKNTVRLVLSPRPAEDTRAFLREHSSDHLLPEDFMDTMVRCNTGECQAIKCCICLEELDPESTVVQLPCRHAFHPQCAESWLTRCPTVKRAKCPMCRQCMAPLQMIPQWSIEKGGKKASL